VSSQAAAPEERAPQSQPEEAAGRPAEEEPATLLDCRGLRCPAPVIALARRLPELPIGAVLRILADDPAAHGDIAAWCRMRGQEFVDASGPHAFDVRRAQ
jgi:tRNA 2-thiouridine synthesizing protein A